MTYKILKSGVRDSVFGVGCVICDSVNIYEAQFGDECFVGPWVEVQNNVIIGDRVRIQSHSVICEGMKIGNNTFIGHGVMTANSKYPEVKRESWECLPPQIGDNVSIGSNSTILPNIKIGDGAVIGAGCIVTKDIPPGATVISASTLRILGNGEKG
jgi:UDP-2-acetamido-3-amino-2,3-dideoxy-glucuronate N-acetyltransferase